MADTMTKSELSDELCERLRSESGETKYPLRLCLAATRIITTDSSKSLDKAIRSRSEASGVLRIATVVRVTRATRSLEIHRSRRTRDGLFPPRKETARTGGRR